MRYKINNAEEVFKPVKVEIICETLEELQEFQCRMALYRSQIATHIPEIRMLSGNASCMSGITSLRKSLMKQLGKNSMVEVT